MKILKYTFTMPKLEVRNGELTITGNINETYTFTLLHKGIGIFEELAKRPLMSYLTSLNVEDDKAIENLLSKDFIPNLACASYVKIEDGKFHNNRATAEEFKKTSVYSRLTDDLIFVKELLQMAIDCITESESAKAKTKSNVDRKKQ